MIKQEIGYQRESSDIFADVEFISIRHCRLVRISRLVDNFREKFELSVDINYRCLLSIENHNKLQLELGIFKLTSSGAPFLYKAKKTVLQTLMKIRVY